MGVKSFDMAKCICTVNGVPVSGWADGDALTVEFAGDDWTKYVGCDSEVTRIYQNRKDGQITLRLSPLAAANARLAALKRLDDTTGLATAKIAIFDMLGGDQVFSNESWCIKDPGMVKGRDITEKEWVYDCANVQVIHGGGTSL